MVYYWGFAISEACLLLGVKDIDSAELSDQTQSTILSSSHSNTRNALCQKTCSFTILYFSLVQALKRHTIARYSKICADLKAVAVQFRWLPWRQLAGNWQQWARNGCW